MATCSHNGVNDPVPSEENMPEWVLKFMKQINGEMKGYIQHLDENLDWVLAMEQSQEDTHGKEKRTNRELCMITNKGLEVAPSSNHGVSNLTGYSIGT
ncbi:hypothetical protein CDL15_Pgr017558 [Punica granatum]|uniref:Uncharacterized protein n=1 Tax=Punica granatum TaxID=22663 RepID=A0A218W6R3_PUNGR|nr:hypothetical protein CDL15_Pgr017558 [Punica granatum]